MDTTTKALLLDVVSNDGSPAEVAAVLEELIVGLENGENTLDPECSALFLEVVAVTAISRAMCAVGGVSTDDYIEAIGNTCNRMLSGAPGWEHGGSVAIMKMVGGKMKCHDIACTTCYEIVGEPN